MLDYVGVTRQIYLKLLSALKHDSIAKEVISSKNTQLTVNLLQFFSLLEDFLYYTNSPAQILATLRADADVDARNAVLYQFQMGEHRSAVAVAVAAAAHGPAPNAPAADHWDDKELARECVAVIGKHLHPSHMRVVLYRLTDGVRVLVQTPSGGWRGTRPCLTFTRRRRPW